MMFVCLPPLGAAGSTWFSSFFNKSLGSVAEIESFNNNCGGSSDPNGLTEPSSLPDFEARGDLTSDLSPGAITCIPIGMQWETRSL